MLPRSKVVLALLIALPILLAVPLWQAAQNRPRLWGVLPTMPTALTLSSGEKMAAFVDGSGAVGVIPVRGTQRSFQPKVANTNLSPLELRFADDGKTLLASNVRLADSRPALYAWDIGSGQIQWVDISDLPANSCRYWVAADGKRAIQRVQDEITVMDISRGGAKRQSKKLNLARTFPVLSQFKIPTSGSKTTQPLLVTLALSPDNKTVVGANEKGQLEFWDALTGKLRLRTKATSATVSTDWKLQYSPDGRFVALFDGTTLSIWDVGAGEWLTTTVSHTGTEVTLAWMPDSRSLWTGAGSIQQWSVPALKRLRDLPVGGPVAVSSDGHTLITRAMGGNGFPGGIWAWSI